MFIKRSIITNHIAVSVTVIECASKCTRILDKSYARWNGDKGLFYALFYTVYLFIELNSYTEIVNNMYNRIQKKSS
jgi:Ca2+/Na+ antiporter